MNVTNQQNTPLGVYLLSIFFIVTAVGILYYTITIASYIFIGIIAIPLFGYMGIGIVKQWPGVKQTIIVVSILISAGALADITSALFLEETNKSLSLVSIISIVIRLMLYPSVWFYFRNEEVKTYFELAT
jgi:hypothetical protein